MDFYTAERLKPYAINLDLPYEILPFIAGRINWGSQISLMDLAKEIQFKFNNHPYLKENTLKRSPQILWRPLSLIYCFESGRTWQNATS